MMAACLVVTERTSVAAANGWPAAQRLRAAGCFLIWPQQHRKGRRKSPVEKLNFDVNDFSVSQRDESAIVMRTSLADQNN
jgi:hypothetical protein